jgi:cyclase
MEHFLEAIEAGATVLLAASVFHFHLIDIQELKSYLQKNGINIK